MATAHAKDLFTCLDLFKVVIFFTDVNRGKSPKPPPFGTLSQHQTVANPSCFKKKIKFNLEPLLAPSSCQFLVDR